MKNIIKLMSLKQLMSNGHLIALFMNNGHLKAPFMSDGHLIKCKLNPSSLTVK
jgi:hypothetical protein